MSLLDSIKNVFGRASDAPPVVSAENKIKTPPPSNPPPSPANAGIADALDVPPDVGTSYPVGPNTPQPAGRLARSERERRMEIAEAEAELRRAELRENTARLKRETENRWKAESERAAAEVEAARTAPPKNPTWEESFKPYCQIELGAVSLEFILALVRHGKLGGLLAEKAREIEPHCITWERAWNERASLASDAVRARIRATLEHNSEAIKAGRPSDIEIVPDRQRIEDEYAQKRAACREVMRASSMGSRPIIVEVAAALQASARVLAVEREAAERASAAEFGVPFRPSALLLELVAAGFHLRRRIEETFVPGPLSDPRECLFGLLNKTKRA